MSTARYTTIHASTIAFARGGEWDALVITGPSGSGKSSLALSLMAMGARLVADDQTQLHVADGRLHASAPPDLVGRIEARNLGILAADPVALAQVRACVDLTRLETRRLPSPAQVDMSGVSVALLQRIDNPAFPAMLRQYMVSETWRATGMSQASHPLHPSDATR